jgi:hypothetical protein
MIHNSLVLSESEIDREAVRVIALKDRRGDPGLYFHKVTGSTSHDVARNGEIILRY